MFYASIWAPGSIPILERKYAVPLKRFVLPGYDVILLVSGFIAVRSGIPALERLLPPGAAAMLAILLVLTSMAAFIGVAFPAMWRMEQVAKLAIVSVLGLYFAAVVTVGGSSREFIAVIILLALPVPLFRLWLLGIEQRDRIAEKERDE